jgi:hypothetical protein
MIDRCGVSNLMGKCAARGRHEVSDSLVYFGNSPVQSIEGQTPLNVKAQIFNYDDVAFIITF